MKVSALPTNNNVADNLYRVNARIQISVFLVLYITLAIGIFVVLKIFFSQQLLSLLKSQSYSIAIQDWRQVLNGILSGWSLYPNLNAICLYSNERLVASNNNCSQIEAYQQYISGSHAFAVLNDQIVAARFGHDIWLGAFILPILILLPAGIIFLSMRRPLIGRAYLDIAQKIKTLATDTNNKYEKIVFDQMNQLIMLNEQKTHFDVARQVAHDIRSPLSSLQILGAIEIDTSEKKALLQQTIGQIKKISDDLLLKSRNYSPTFIDLNATTREFLYLKNIEIGKKVIIEFQDDQRPAIITANATSLHRILSNLINNSVDAKAKKIIITITHNPNTLVLSILDDGRGIPNEIIPQIGNSNFTHGKEDGNGIGLFYAFAQLKIWKATIKIENIGHGTKVDLVFPIQSIKTI